MSRAICDFCSYPSVVWCYPARSFVAYIVANIGGESVGDWAACEQCHRLIEAGDRAGLMERSLVTLSASAVRANMRALLGIVDQNARRSRAVSTENTAK